VKKTVFVFSTLIISFLILFRISEYAFLFGNTSIELIISVVAVAFLIIGLYINKKRTESVSEKNQDV